MSDLSNEACAERLRMALDLADSGIRMRRVQLRREHPEATDEELRELFKEWLRHPEGAPHGDAAGRPVDPSSIL